MTNKITKPHKASIRERERERERERVKSLRDFTLHLITANIFERRFWRRFLYLQKGRKIKKVSITPKQNPGQIALQLYGTGKFATGQVDRNIKKLINITDQLCTN